MTVEATDTLAGRVREALRLVIDPELGDNVIELGLVYYVAVEDTGVAHIVMTTTTRGCPAAAYLKEGACDSALTVPGIVRAEVSLTYDPPWAPEMMTPEARSRLGITERGRR